MSTLQTCNFMCFNYTHAMANENKYINNNQENDGGEKTKSNYVNIIVNQHMK